MRKLMALMAVLAVAPRPAGAETDCGCYVPSLEEIARFEERVAELPEPVYHYARYYAGSLLPPVTFRGQVVVPRRLQAEFIPLAPGEASAIHIVERRLLPPLTSEACIVYLDAPPQSDAFQLAPRCNAPGGWKPGAAEIAELERGIVLPHGAAPLARYARHYAGVTEDGVRLIRGVFVDGKGVAPDPTMAPGVTVASEVELPAASSGDGCHAIEVEHNPETKQASVHCSDN